MDNSFNCLICLEPYFPAESSENTLKGSQSGAAWSGRSVDRLINKKVTTIFPCGHKFHHDCISEWASISITCPKDRRPIISSDPEIPLPENLPEQLSAAASNGNLELVNFLLSLGVDVNEKNSELETPLFRAIRNHHVDVIALLMDHGANCTDVYLDLGVMYEHDGNYEEAFRFYQLSAEQGEAEGYNNLGRMYMDAIGVKMDNDKAFICFESSAKQGDPEGQNSLGHMYEYGLGVEQDLQQAFRYYLLSSNQDDPNGQENLERMYTEYDSKDFEIFYDAAPEEFHDPNNPNSGHTN